MRPGRQCESIRVHSESTSLHHFENEQGSTPPLHSFRRLVAFLRLIGAQL